MYEEIDEDWTLYSIIEYVSENFIGLTLLILAFFIIYIVDHINQFNAIIINPQINIPQASSPQMLSQMKVKSKKLNKR
jgi:hypothetical protein